MPNDQRETRAVAEIQCPRCHATPGKPCFVRGEPGKSAHGPACHQERRAANQERRRLSGEAGPIETPKGTTNVSHNMPKEDAYEIVNQIIIILSPLTTIQRQQVLSILVEEREHWFKER